MKRIVLLALVSSLCVIAPAANTGAAIIPTKDSVKQAITQSVNLALANIPKSTTDPCWPSYAVDGYAGEITEDGIVYYVQGIKCADGRKIETDRVAIGPAINPSSGGSGIGSLCDPHGGPVGERIEYVVEGIWLVEWHYLLCVDGTKITIQKTNVRYASTVQPTDPTPQPVPMPASPPSATWTPPPTQEWVAGQYCATYPDDPNCMGQTQYDPGSAGYCQLFPASPYCPANRP